MTAIGVTGHQELPGVALQFIEERIHKTLSPFGADFIGISSLAAGADQIFARAVLQARGSLHVVLPSKNYEASFSDEDARREFAVLLARAAMVEMLPHNSPSETAYLDAGRRIADKSDIVLAVWDGKEAKGKGGTADTVRYAQMRGRQVVVIWPDGVSRE